MIGAGDRGRLIKHLAATPPPVLKTAATPEGAPLEVLDGLPPHR
jgi:hypothetical protein